MKTRLFNSENLPSYNDFVLCQTIFGSRLEHLNFSLSQSIIENNLILEFGVHSGESLSYLCNRSQGKTIFGFDSFEGLPDMWVQGNKVFKAGHFNLDNNLPSVPSNGKLIKGWFSESIPKFLEENADAEICFIHIDCDIYQSTKDVLFLCNTRIKKDCVIVFDELANWRKLGKYKNYQEHEWKALREWIELKKREIKIISRTDSYQAAIQVTK